MWNSLHWRPTTKPHRQRPWRRKCVGWTLLSRRSLAIAKTALLVRAVHLFVCLSPKCVHKNAIFSETKQFRAVVSIGNLYLHGLFIEPIIGRIKFKAAEIRQLENGEVAISQRKIIRFRLNLVHYSTFGTRLQPDDQLWNLFKIQDGGSPPF